MALRLYKGISVRDVKDLQTRIGLQTIDLFLRDLGGLGAQVEALQEAVSSGGAPASEAFVTIGNSANLTSERALAAAAPITFSDGGAGGSVTLGATLATPAITFASVAGPGTAASLIRSDAVLVFPQALRSLTNGFTVTLTDDATNPILTASTGTLQLEAPSSVDVNRGQTSTAATVSTFRGVPQNGQRTLWQANWISAGTLSGVVLRGIDPAMNLSGIFTNVDFRMIEGSLFALTTSSGSGGGNTAYFMQAPGPTITGTPGSWDEVGTLWLGRAKRGLAVVPTVPTGYNIKMEMPNVGQTDQFGIDIQNITDGSQHTPTNRYGIRIGAMVKGTNRVGMEIAVDTGAVAGSHLRLVDKAGDVATPISGDIWRNARSLKFYEGTLTHDLSPLTTKGDVIVHNGTTEIRLPVGTDGQQLTADSTQASGLKWDAAGGGGSGPEFADNLFRVTDNADATKKMAFEVSGITTATTRTYTSPNFNGILQLRSGSGDLLDANGDAVVRIAAGATPVANVARITSSVAGVGVTIGTAGTDANINLLLTGFGPTGTVKAILNSDPSSEVATRGMMGLLAGSYFMGAMA